MGYDDIYLDADERMTKAVDHLKGSLQQIRTGRASSSLVEGIRADVYGSPTPLKQVANIAVPEARLIVIKPFDPSTLSDIEKAIQKSELGIHPQSDGKVIRLEVPPLTEERRKQLVRQVKDMAEEAKKSVNSVRRDANKAADATVKSSEISEDDGKRLKTDIDELKDSAMKRIEGILAAKSDEIMGD